MASGVMQIKYGEERIASKASKACNELEDICSSLSKVRKKLNGLPERSRGGDNLSDASAFLKKKQKQYETRQNALEVLKTRTNNFMSKVETTEKKLSSQIKKEYKQFNKQTGIGKTRGAVILEGAIKYGGKAIKYLVGVLSPVVGLVNFYKTGKKLVTAIKEWYNNLSDGWKYVIKIVITTVAAVALVAAAVAAVIALGPAWAALGTVGSFAAGAIALVKFGAAALTAASATIAALDGLVKWGQAVDVGATYLSGDKIHASELNSQSAAEYFEGKTGLYSNVYEKITTMGAYVGLAGGLISVGFATVEGMKNFATGGKLSKFVNSLKTETFKKFTGVSNLEGLKKYGLKVFTMKMSQDKDYLSALKGLKTVYEWATLKKFTDFGKKVIGAPNAGQFIHNLIDYIY